MSQCFQVYTHTNLKRNKENVGGVGDVIVIRSVMSCPYIFKWILITASPKMVAIFDNYQK